MSTRPYLTAFLFLGFTTLVFSQAEPPATDPAAPEVAIAGAAPSQSSVSRDRDTLSVDFPDEDIRTILRNVADLFEINLVVPDTLTGKTSIKLRDVTWRQIFQVILSPVGFTYVEEGNIIKIVSNESLQLEPTTTDVIIINNAKASDIMPTVTALIDSAAGGKIMVDARSNALVITERPSRMSRIRETIEKLDRATDQVMIETKFVEVTDRDIRNIGVNWASLQGFQVGVGGINQTFTRGRGQVRDGSNTVNNSSTNGSSNQSGSQSSRGTTGSTSNSTANGTNTSTNNGTSNSTNNGTSNSTNNGTTFGTTNGTTFGTNNGTTFGTTNGTSFGTSNGTSSSTTVGSSGGDAITYVTGFPSVGNTVGSTILLPSGVVTGLPGSVPGVTGQANYVPAVPATPAVIGSDGITVITPAVAGTPATATALNTFNGTTTNDVNNGTSGSTSNGTSGSTSNGTSGSTSNGTAGSTSNGTSGSTASGTTGSTASGTSSSTANGTSGSTLNNILSGTANSLTDTLASTLTQGANNAINNLMGLTNSGNTSRLASAVFSASDFNLVLSALKTQNNTKVISNPTIVTLNNTEAMLNIGSEFPIPNYTYNAERGTFEVSGFTYKPIGVILRVTPQVNSQGLIRLNLEPEISQQADATTFGGAGGAQIPIISTRKVKTQVSLQDGYTVGIGGLLSASKSHGGNKVPLLGDIPGLGRLFSSKSVNDATTNLLIFLTAKTVNSDGATPSDVFTPTALNAIGAGEIVNKPRSK